MAWDVVSPALPQRQDQARLRVRDFDARLMHRGVGRLTENRLEGCIVPRSDCSGARITCHSCGSGGDDTLRKSSNQSPAQQCLCLVACETKSGWRQHQGIVLIRGPSYGCIVIDC